jgi:hypothetical protein
MRSGLAILVALFSCSIMAPASPVTYDVTINTTSIAGTSGSLDFNFDPGLLVSQGASLQILNFSSSGTLVGSPSLTGDVSGSLPSTITFDNGTGYNDYFVGFTYGSILSFDVSLYGPALSSPDGISTSGSTFAFSMFADPAGTIPTLTSNKTDGFAFLVNVNLDGTTSVTNYSTQTSGLPGPVPEPGSLVLLGTGFACGILSWSCHRLRRPRLDTVTHRSKTATVLFSLATTSACLANAQCPAVGADSNCGVVLAIQDIGTGKGTCSATNCISISNNQGPYDGSDDTLVGVVNNSSIPIASLALTSGNPIFGFDGDGLCTYITCSWPHPTGYEGPGVIFNPTSSTTGTVNFSPPIAAGATAYFSLENSLTGATACTSIINNSVHHALVNNGTGMTALFTSNTNLANTLKQAAMACGFTDWDWQQTVTLEPCGVAVEAGTTTPLKAPFNDPPPQGYDYQLPPNAVQIAVYWNPYTPMGTVTNPGGLLTSLADHKPTPSTMNFEDGPAVGCLSGNPDGTTGKKVGFTTHLVGLVGSGPGYGVQDTGVGFSWTTTFNGTNGGIHVLNSAASVDPGSGTGGIAITMVNGVSSYQYPKSFGVSEINGAPVSSGSPAPAIFLDGSQIAATSSGLAYSRVTQTFNATVTITNVSNSTIDGPFEIVFDSLTTGVTLANATSSFGGWPFITVPAVGSLAPGQSASASVRFKNPSNALINVSPVIYSGTFN